MSLESGSYLGSCGSLCTSDCAVAERGPVLDVPVYVQCVVEHAEDVHDILRRVPQVGYPVVTEQQNSNVSLPLRTVPLTQVRKLTQ